MPLTQAAVGAEVRVIAIYGGRRLRRRLADLGINIGMVIRVLQRNQHGPLILAVKDARMAVGHGVAHKIMVEPAGG